MVVRTDAKVVVSTVVEMDVLVAVREDALEDVQILVPMGAKVTVQMVVEGRVKETVVTDAQIIVVQHV